MKDFEDVYSIRYFPQFHGEDGEKNSSGLLETYGPEFQFLNEYIAQHPGNIKYVWTIVEDDYNNLVACAGIHRVNRLNFLISNEPWKEEDEVYIWCEFDHEDEEDD